MPGKLTRKAREYGRKTLAEAVELEALRERAEPRRPGLPLAAPPKPTSYALGGELIRWDGVTRA